MKKVKMEIVDKKIENTEEKKEETVKNPALAKDILGNDIFKGDLIMTNNSGSSQDVEFGIPWGIDSRSYLQVYIFSKSAVNNYYSRVYTAAGANIGFVQNKNIISANCIRIPISLLKKNIPGIEIYVENLKLIKKIQ